MLSPGSKPYFRVSTLSFEADIPHSNTHSEKKRCEDEQTIKNPMLIWFFPSRAQPKLAHSQPPNPKFFAVKKYRRRTSTDHENKNAFQKVLQYALCALNE